VRQREREREREEEGERQRWREQVCVLAVYVRAVHGNRSWLLESRHSDVVEQQEDGEKKEGGAASR